MFLLCFISTVASRTGISAHIMQQQKIHCCQEAGEWIRVKIDLLHSYILSHQTFLALVTVTYDLQVLDINTVIYIISARL